MQVDSGYKEEKEGYSETQTAEDQQEDRDILACMDMKPKCFQLNRPDKKKQGKPKKKCADYPQNMKTAASCSKNAHDQQNIRYAWKKCHNAAKHSHEQELSLFGDRAYGAFLSML